MAVLNGFRNLAKIKKQNFTKKKITDNDPNEENFFYRDDVYRQSNNIEKRKRHMIGSVG